MSYSPKGSPSRPKYTSSFLSVKKTLGAANWGDFKALFVFNARRLGICCGDFWLYLLCIGENMNKSLQVYIENPDFYVMAWVSVFYKKEDSSFDHEFGLTKQFSWVPDEIIIDSVVDPETGEKMIAGEELKKLIIEKATEKALNCFL